MANSTVWKFELFDDVVLLMPEDAEVLTVREQGQQICLWALVDPDAGCREPRRFVTVGTGQALPKFASENYIGTSMLSGGALVFHTFEVFEVKE